MRKSLDGRTILARESYAGLLSSTRPARETVNDTLRLAAGGEFATALVLLHRAVREAIVQGESVATLARHPGVIAEQARDLRPFDATTKLQSNTILNLGRTWPSEMFAVDSVTTKLRACITRLVG